MRRAGRVDHGGTGFDEHIDQFRGEQKRSQVIGLICLLEAIGRRLGLADQAACVVGQYVDARVLGTNFVCQGAHLR
jgi:hypothetical protein